MESKIPDKHFYQENGQVNAKFYHACIAAMKIDPSIKSQTAAKKFIARTSAKLL
jgi:hypothetical protein